jgi:curved DNA-binding protein CbpA
MGDYYELLQVHVAATFEEIHRAYRAMAMRHHPDRDSTPGAALTMAALNEAYAVLSDPGRRRRYDQERAKGRPPDVGSSILAAAQETLLRHGWIVEENDESHLLLAQGLHSVRVTFVRRLNNALLAKIGRRFAGFSVVLTVEVETPINLSFNTAVIDLVHSRRHGAPFPDDAYRSLFAAFLDGET